jgi:hypothetical protein
MTYPTLSARSFLNGQKSKLYKYNNQSPERIKRMRIHEILFWNNDPAEEKSC